MQFQISDPINSHMYSSCSKNTMHKWCLTGLKLYHLHKTRHLPWGNLYSSSPQYYTISSHTFPGNRWRRDTSLFYTKHLLLYIKICHSTGICISLFLWGFFLTYIKLSENSPTLSVFNTIGNHWRNQFHKVISNELCDQIKIDVFYASKNTDVSLLSSLEEVEKNIFSKGSIIQNLNIGGLGNLDI